ncbi:MAG: leucine-rich repeat domain-containing protein [Promethearchaeota archaeon]
MDTHVSGLGLYKCGLTALLESFGNLKSLQTLDLEENELTTLPESFLKLSSLKRLWIQNNPLDSYAQAILKKLMNQDIVVKIKST